MVPHTDLDEYKLIGIHLIALYVNSSSVTYFDGFGVEYMPKEIQQICLEFKHMIQ